MIAAAGASRSYDRLSRAAAALAGNDCSEAYRLYRQVLDETPDDPMALNGLGMVALRHDPSEAADWFSKAASRDPEAKPLWVNLATAHRARGNIRGERDALESALAIDQTDLVANLRLAELQDRSGESDGAVGRWRGIVTMLESAQDRTPEMDAILVKARSRVTEHFKTWGVQLDSDLARVREPVADSARRRFDACVDMMLGRRNAFTNVCHGLYYPFLPADEFFEREHFPWFAQVEAQTAQIRAEFAALFANDRALFEPYVQMQSGTPANKWSPLDRSTDWSALFLQKFGVRNEALRVRCPKTAAILDALPLAEIEGKGSTAFFSVLEPGARLPAHTGVTNVRAIVHLPLIVPPGCGFRVGGETRAWHEGEAFAFDDTIEHEAWNDSGLPRVLLIFDVWNPHLSETERELVAGLFRVTAQRSPAPAGSGDIY